jgi:hypothetical protein
VCLPWAGIHLAFFAEHTFVYPSTSLSRDGSRFGESISLFLVNPQRESSGGMSAHFRDDRLHFGRHLFK